MKKVLALVLTLMMVLSLASAFAETAEITSYEDLFDGVWVQFEDGFELYLPAEWVEFETTAEMNAEGIFFMCGSEDAAYTCTLAWTPLEAETSVEEAHEALAETYPGAKVVEVNGIALIVFADLENSLLNFVALDATEPGLYMFAFSPVEDEDFRVLASVIASSIRHIETAV